MTCVIMLDAELGKGDTDSLLYETLLYFWPSGKLVLRFSLFPPQLAPPGGSRSSRQVGGVHP